MASSVTVMAYYQVVCPQPCLVDFHRYRIILGSYWVRYRHSLRAGFKGGGGVRCCVYRRGCILRVAAYYSIVTYVGKAAQLLVLLKETFLL